MSSVLIDFGSQEFLDDPYPIYSHLRENDPVMWFPHSPPSSTDGMWLITRYEDVELVLKDKRFSKDVSRFAPEETGDVLARSLVFRDPPDHTRLRSLINVAFTPKMVRELEPKIVEITRLLLDKMEEQGKSDFIAGLALPLPVIVIAEMLGVPADDRDLFHEWSGRILGNGDAFRPSEEDRRLGQEAQESLVDYLEELIGERRRQPQNDLISALLEAQEGESRLSDDEMLATCALLLIAGHETTMNLIGSGMLLLLRHRDQLRRLRDDSSLVESAVEEMLRCESPSQRSSYRFAGENVVVGGQEIVAGQQVSAIIGAANRDPRQFPEAETFDVSRQPNRHLAFGRGIHFCLGAPLARTETRIAFETILSRFPSIDGDISKPQWRTNTGLRGLRELEVEFA